MVRCARAPSPRHAANSPASTGAPARSRKPNTLPLTASTMRVGSASADRSPPAGTRDSASAICRRRAASLLREPTARITSGANASTPEIAGALSSAAGAWSLQPCTASGLSRPSRVPAQRPGGSSQSMAVISSGMRRVARVIGCDPSGVTTSPSTAAALSSCQTSDRQGTTTTSKPSSAASRQAVSALASSPSPALSSTSCGRCRGCNPSVRANIMRTSPRSWRRNGGEARGR